MTNYNTVVNSVAALSLVSIVSFCFAILFPTYAVAWTAAGIAFFVSTVVITVNYERPGLSFASASILVLSSITTLSLWAYGWTRAPIESDLLYWTVGLSLIVIDLFWLGWVNYAARTKHYDTGGFKLGVILGLSIATSVLWIMSAILAAFDQPSWWLPIVWGFSTLGVVVVAMIRWAR